ncbi:MAG: hypothetical protein ACYTFV_12380 [Planctomycetota bacterium]
MSALRWGGLRAVGLPILGLAGLGRMPATGQDAPADLQSIDSVPVGARGDDGAWVAEGAWVVEGGTPARSRRVRTPAPSSPPQLAWTYRPRGVIVGEPVVWGDLIVIEERRDASTRSLALLDRTTGRRLGKEVVFSTEDALSPAIWSGCLVVRGESGSLLAYAAGPGGLHSTWERPLDVPSGPPLLVDRTVYVTAAGKLLALEVGRSSPRFEVEGDFIGAVSLHGRELVVLEHRRELGGGYLRAVRLDAETGERLGWRQLIRVTPEIGDLEEARLYPLEGGELLFVEGRIELDRQSTRSLALYGMENVESGDFAFTHPYLAEPPAQIDGGFVARRETVGQSGPSWAVIDADGSTDLASDTLRRDVAARIGPPAASATQLLLGGLAVDPHTLEVDWAIPTAGTLIPVREGVLVVGESGKVLEGWLAMEPSSPAEGEPIGAVAVGWTSPDATAVLEGGEVITGDLTLESPGTDLPPRLVRRRGASKGRFEWERVRLLFTDEAIVWASSAAGLRESVEALVDAHWRSSLEDAVKSAVKARDPELLWRLLDAGARAGVDARSVERLTAGLADLDRRPELIRPGRGSEPWAELERDRRASRDVRLDWLERLDGFDGGAAVDSVQWALARDAVSDDPRSARVTAWLENRLEIELGSVAGIEPAAALELWRASNRAGARLIDALSIPESSASPAELALDEARREWREDLVAIETDRAVVIAPRGALGRASEVSIVAEVLMGALRGWIAALEPVRAKDQKVEIWVHDDLGEYTRLAGAGGSSTEAGDGFASVEAVPTRVHAFFPDEFELSATDLLRVLGPALVRHALDSAAARLSGDSSDLLCLGFARMFEDGPFEDWSAEDRPFENSAVDGDGGEVVSGARVGWSLARLASLPEDALIPWSELFELGPEDLRALAGAAPVEIEVALQLGQLEVLDRLAVAEVQAIAFVRYLFGANSGERRGALLEWLDGRVSGAEDTAGFEQTFGLDPAELGALTRAWSRAVVTAELSIR